MQTFLPYSNFKKSAACLDMKRLGNQRNECKQIIECLTNNSKKGWRNHPAVKMWDGYVDALKEYTNAIIIEWVKRGYKNNLKLYKIENQIEYPWWLGNENFHRAMRSKLIFKKPEHYLKYFGKEDINFNESMYLWSDNQTRTFKIINNGSSKSKSKI